MEKGSSHQISRLQPDFSMKHKSYENSIKITYSRTAKQISLEWPQWNCCYSIPEGLNDKLWSIHWIEIQVPKARQSCEKEKSIFRFTCFWTSASLRAILRCYYCAWGVRKTNLKNYRNRNTPIFDHTIKKDSQCTGVTPYSDEKKKIFRHLIEWVRSQRRSMKFSFNHMIRLREWNQQLEINRKKWTSLMVSWMLY